MSCCLPACFSSKRAIPVSSPPGAGKACIGHGVSGLRVGRYQRERYKAATMHQRAAAAHPDGDSRKLQRVRCKVCVHIKSHSVCRANMM